MSSTQDTQDATAAAGPEGDTGQPGAADARAGGRPDGAAQAGGAAAPGSGGAAPGQPSEAELRAAYEAELSRITSAEMVLQAAVSLLNIGARRLGLVGGAEPGAPVQGGSAHDPERDLEQVRDAIDAVRGLLPVVERRAPEQVRPLRDALSQLQMAYAREAPPAQPHAGPAPGQGAPGRGAPGQEGAPGQGAPAPHGGPDPSGPSGPPGAPRPPAAPGGQPAPAQPQPGSDQHRPGPAESSGRLWVPGR